MLFFYGEARAEVVKRKSGGLYEMDKDFKRRGVPIDCVGLQRHIFNLNPNVQSIDENIARFTKLGVQLQITQMDVALPAVRPRIPRGGRPFATSRDLSSDRHSLPATPRLHRH